MLTRLYVDFDTGRVLRSNVQNSEALVPDAYWKNYWQLEVYPVKPNPAGGLRNQLIAQDVTDYTLQLYLSNTAFTLLASQITWTKDEANNKFSATVNLNTTAMNTAFAANPASLPGYIEFRLIGDGEPRSVRKPITLLRPLYTGSELDPEAYETPEALSENLALILDDSDTVNVQQTGNNFSFDVICDPDGGIEAGASGIKVKEAFAGLAAYEAQLPALRLESPFEAASTTIPENNTDSEVVTFGGTAGTIYTTRLRVRGRSEVKQYTGGDVFSGVFATEAAKASRFYRGGTPNNSTGDAANNTVWKLEISEPAQTYYLNYDPTFSSALMWDYITPEIRIAAGASVTLSYDTINSVQLEATDEVPGVDAPAEDNTPFIEITAVDLVLPEEITRTWAASMKLQPFTPMQYISLGGATEFTELGNQIMGQESTVLFYAATTCTIDWSAIAFNWLNGEEPTQLDGGQRAVLKVFPGHSAVWIAEGNETAYGETTFEDAGTTDITLGYHTRRHTQKINANADYSETAYTRNIVLKTTHATAGDVVELVIDVEASVAPTLNIRNATSGGTILRTITGEPYAQYLIVSCYFNGTAWVLRKAGQQDEALCGNEWDQEALTEDAGGSQVIDFNGAPFQTLTITDDISFATTNRVASAARARSVAVLVTASGGPRAIAFHASIKEVGTWITSLADGESCWINFTSMGSAETATYAATVLNG